MRHLEIAFFLLLALFTNGLYAAAYGGGSGTEDDPYQIRTARQMNDIGTNPADWGETFILMADINMSAYHGTEYHVIGNKNIPFTGTFDGNHFKIRNLTCIAMDTDHVGLFGCIADATIQNLGLVKVTLVSECNYIGGLVGHSRESTIKNCYVTGSVQGYDCVGGLAGCNENGTIRGCYAACSIRMTADGLYNAGGLVGHNLKGEILSSYATGSLAGDDSIGGLAGYSEGGVIEKCHAAGSVRGTKEDSANIGGFVGYHSKGSMTSCHADGLVSGISNIGGLAGFNDGDLTDCYATGPVQGSGNNDYDAENTGGLVGILKQGTITSCHATGAVVGDYSVGGLVGQNEDGQIEKSYATGPVSMRRAGEYCGIGGLVGENYGTLNSCYAAGMVTGKNDTFDIGGLVGSNCYQISNCYSTGEVRGGSNSYDIGGLTGSNSDEVSKCYSTGKVSSGTGSTDIGGLCGLNDGTLKACFWDNQTSGQIRSDGGYGKTTAQMQTLSTFTSAGWHFVDETVYGDHDGWAMAEGASYPELYETGQIRVDSCALIAGSKTNSDMVFVSGSLNVKEYHLWAADDIRIYAGYIDRPYPYVTTASFPCVGVFPLNISTSGCNNINSLSLSSAYGKSSFKYDIKTGQFTFSARQLNLNGMACPVIIEVTIGSYNAQVELDETVVNADKPCPVRFLKGVKNTLAVTKYKLVQGRKRGTASFAAQGTFTLGDDYDKSNPLVITLGSQTYTVNGDKFAAKNSIESCKNAASSEGAIVDARFDFAKCTYTILVKNIEINQGSTVDFGINCFGVNLEGLAAVSIN